MILLTALAFSADGAQAVPQGTPALSHSEAAAFRRANEVRKVISDYGKCVVRRKAAAVSVFLLAEPKSKELEQLTYDDITDQFCLAIAGGERVVSAYFPAGTLRYTLAEAMVQKEFPRTPMQSFAHVPALPSNAVDLSELKPKPGLRPSKRRDRWIQQSRAAAVVNAFIFSYGECVVRTDPIESHRLLMTDVTGPEESAALGRLKPMLAACIPHQQKMAFNKASIRGAIGLAYYRLAKASSGAGRLGEAR